jgi:hypothetical protein
MTAGSAVRALAACAALLAASSAAAQAPQWLKLGPKVKPFQQAMLDSHNQERAAVGVAPLRWDPVLASAAQDYARQLAATGKWGHSDARTRRGQGENLWMGTRGAFTSERMVADWASEKRMFRAGLFPAVTTTRNWADVGHYTQIVWRETTSVGCALESSAAHDYLVCRYGPGGNVMNRRVF